MAEIVNLRQARKRKSRTDEREAAAGNRARFGRTRAEKAIDAADRDRLDRTVDDAALPHGLSSELPDDETPRRD